MIRVENVSKQNSHRILFIEASATLQRQEKAGLVGPNGAGKTTLFRMITREEQPDEGQVSVDRGVTVGYFSQDVGEMAGRTVSKPPSVRTHRRFHYRPVILPQCGRQAAAPRVTGVFARPFARCGSNGGSGMMWDREPEVQTSAMVPPWDLEQIRDAVGALRASCPDSALADLVEEKIRVIENGAPVPPPASFPQGAAAGRR